MSKKLNMKVINAGERAKTAFMMPLGVKDLVARYKSAKDTLTPRIKKSEVYDLLIELSIHDFLEEIEVMEAKVDQINSLKNS